jgi:hypothetical protein
MIIYQYLYPLPQCEELWILLCKIAIQASGYTQVPSYDGKKKKNGTWDLPLWAIAKWLPKENLCEGVTLNEANNI